MSVQLMVELMMSYTHTKCEIAELKARNQSAPKYLYTQAMEIHEKVSQLAFKLDAKLQAASYTGNE